MTKEQREALCEELGKAYLALSAASYISPSDEIIQAREKVLDIARKQHCWLRLQDE